MLSQPVLIMLLPVLPFHLIIIVDSISTLLLLLLGLILLLLSWLIMLLPQTSKPACTSPAITAALLVSLPAQTYLVVATPLLAGDAAAQHQDHSIMMAVAAQV
jgi:hypothetical protein